LPWNRNFAGGAGLPSALMHDPVLAPARPGFDGTMGAVIPFYLQEAVVRISDSPNMPMPM